MHDKRSTEYKHAIQALDSALAGVRLLTCLPRFASFCCMFKFIMAKHWASHDMAAASVLDFDMHVQ